MAGRVPAIRPPTVLAQMAGTRPAMTDEEGIAQQKETTDGS
jgi:hypothetical protein